MVIVQTSELIRTKKNKLTDLGNIADNTGNQLADTDVVKITERH